MALNPEIDKQIEEEMIYAADIGKFAKDIVPDKEVKELTDFQKEWINAVENHRRVAISAPTGFGKSAVLGVLYVVWKAWRENNFNALIVSKSQDQSTTLLDRIKKVLDSHPLLKKKVDKHDNLWSRTEIELKNESKIFCKPYASSIRGVDVQYILADEVATFKRHDIFNHDVVTRAHARGTVCAISTPVSEMDLINKLIKKWKDKDYGFGKIYSAMIKENGKEKSLWEEHYPLKYLREAREEDPHTFKREYMCDPKISMNALFPTEDVVECFDDSLVFSEPKGRVWKCKECGERYNDKIETCNKKKGITVCNGEVKKLSGRVFMGVDLAMSTKRKADYSVYTVVEQLEGKLYLRDMYRYKGLSQERQEQKIEWVYEQHVPQRIFIDASNFGASFVESLKSKQLPVTGCKFSSGHRTKYLLNLRKAIDKGILVIPRNDKDARTEKLTRKLANELAGFEVEQTKAGNITYSSKTAHDDTVMSLALAVQGFKEKKPMTVGAKV